MRGWRASVSVAAAYRDFTFHRVSPTGKRALEQARFTQEKLLAGFGLLPPRAAAVPRR